IYSSGLTISKQKKNFVLVKPIIFSVRVFQEFHSITDLWIIISKIISMTPCVCELIKTKNFPCSILFI
ncbi:hypothetical protein DERP_000347, partial [Dermatophagoides pteronyssinus]